MNNYEGAEFVITPETVHVLMEHIHDSRRIYTDGRAWPAFIEPSFNGYSIGKWVDDGNTGQYNVLEVESRGFKGPRAYDNTGLPLHPDNQSVFKERIYLDKADPNLIHNEITTIDNALTRPWTVTRNSRRAAKAVWVEHLCEVNYDFYIGNENYFVGGGDYLMPTRKDQPAPGLRGFDPAQQ